MQEEVRKLIAQGETLQAVNFLIGSLKETGHYSSVSNELILYSSRLVSNARNLRMNLISHEEANRLTAQVNYALLEMLDSIEKKDKPDPFLAKDEFPATGSAQRIMFLEANPFDDINLHSGKESRELEYIFRNHPNKARFVFQKEFAISPKTLLQVVNEYRPDILHVSAFANEEGIILHDEDYSKKMVANDSVMTIFSLFDTKISCAFFNTWISTGLAIQLSEKIPSIIGINALIDTHAAISFATGFYQAVAFNKDYPAAFETGIKVLTEEGYGSEVKKPFLVQKGKLVSEKPRDD